MTTRRTRRRRLSPQPEEHFVQGVVHQAPFVSWGAIILPLAIIIFRPLSSYPSTHLIKPTSLYYSGSAFSVVIAAAAETTPSEEDGDDILPCPGPDEAFVTTCSGSGSDGDEIDQLTEKQTPSPAEISSSNDDDISDLVHEVFSDGSINNDENISEQKQQPHNQHESENSGNIDYDNMKDERQQQQEQSWGDGTTQSQQHQQEISTSCNNNAFPSSSNEDTEYSAYYQLKKTTATFVHRYYSPLDKRGKCAIGSACGFLASRLSLGVANRIFRVAGATWVFSEAVHASGLCDETSCAVIPEEARPWIVILRRSIGQKVKSIRRLARRLWNKERIREIARQDEAMACGFAAGAFVGFIV